MRDPLLTSVLPVGADLDHSNPDVSQDVLDWGTWVVQETGHVGFRFDAIKVSAYTTECIGHTDSKVIAHRPQLHGKVCRPRSGQQR